MNTLAAFAMGEANRDKELKVFDWNKAAGIIKERKLENASAGLLGDWEWTAGMILEEGKPVKSEYMYLASTWATPALYDEEGNYTECWVMKSETEWDAHTRWPKSALEILKEEYANDPE